MITGTSGAISIDLTELWRDHWLRAWEDIGRLVALHVNEEHIPKHELPRWGVGDLGHCECFNCRVVTAWQRRHEPIKTPRRCRR